jgi:quinol monooxygenase YgiN
MSKVGVIVKFTAKAGKKDELAEHLQSLVEAAEAENGTEDWAVHLSPIEENAVWIYEVYKDQAAMDTHNGARETVEAKVHTSELTEGAPQVFPLLPFAGKGFSE